MPRLTIPQRYTAGLLLLTMSTGVIDATSYLALDRVFTGNMTGNVLFIGFALVGVPGIPLLNNVVALSGFVFGSILSGRILGRRYDQGFPTRSVATLAGGAVIASGLLATWVVVRDLAQPGLLVVTFLLAVVMGSQVTAVKPIGNSDVTTIVVTNTVANLARDSRLAGGPGERWIPRLLAVAAMGVGAAIGAGLIRFSGGPAALGSALVIFVAGAMVLGITHRSAAMDTPVNRAGEQG